MAFSLPNILIKPYHVPLFREDRPLCAPLPYNSGTPKYLCGVMSPWGTRNWTSAIGTRQFTMAFSLLNIVIKPYIVTLFHEDCPSVLPCPKTQEHKSTCEDSWVHRVPENGHQPLGRGKSLWRSACPILWSNPILLRYFTEIAPLCSLALGLRNTKLPVWTHESIGYPKMDISHWDAAIHNGVQLGQYCDQTLSCYVISRRLPLCAPLP